MYAKHIVDAQQILAIMIMFFYNDQVPLDPGLHTLELERSGFRPAVPLSTTDPRDLLQSGLHRWEFLG